MSRHRKRLSDEHEKYIRMVEAVRDWLAVAYPDADQIEILECHRSGVSYTLAAFHAEPGNSYAFGDAKAACRC